MVCDCFQENNCRTLDVENFERKGNTNEGCVVIPRYLHIDYCSERILKIRKLYV